MILNTWLFSFYFDLGVWGIFLSVFLASVLGLFAYCVYYYYYKKSFSTKFVNENVIEEEEQNKDSEVLKKGANHEPEKTKLNNRIQHIDNVINFLMENANCKSDEELREPKDSNLQIIQKTTMETYTSYFCFNIVFGFIALLEALAWSLDGLIIKKTCDESVFATQACLIYLGICLSLVGFGMGGTISTRICKFLSQKKVQSAQQYILISSLILLLIGSVIGLIISLNSNHIAQLMLGTNQD